MTFRPLLGAKLGDKKTGRTIEEDFKRLRFPMLASMKLDGWRAIWTHKEFMSRTNTTIPNRLLQQKFVQLLDGCAGWDGELIFGSPCAPDTFRATDSCLKKHHADPTQVRFFVFDNASASYGYEKRQQSLFDIGGEVVVLEQHLVRSVEETLELERQALADGYEGLILRQPNGAYKQGRSTLNEQYLVKLKRFVRFRAEVVGFEEMMHNENEATTSATGYTKRSHHQSGKRPAGVLGSLTCRVPGRPDFSVGTGFTAADRKHIWDHREMYLGLTAECKSFPYGEQDAPRHAVFLSWPTA